MQNKYLDIKQAAVYVNRSTRTLQNWIKAGMPFTYTKGKTGSKKMFSVADLEVWKYKKSSESESELEGIKHKNLNEILGEFNERIIDEYTNLYNSYIELKTKYNELHDRYVKDIEKYNNLPDYIKQLIDDHNNIKNAVISKRYVPPSLRAKILKRDSYSCVWCGSTAKDGIKLHVDHIIPVNSEKGKTMTVDELNAPENLRTLCNRCNIGKSNKLDEQL